MKKENYTLACCLLLLDRWQVRKVYYVKPKCYAMTQSEESSEYIRKKGVHGDSENSLYNTGNKPMTNDIQNNRVRA